MDDWNHGGGDHSGSPGYEGTGHEDSGAGWEDHGKGDQDHGAGGETGHGGGAAELAGKTTARAVRPGTEITEPAGTTVREIKTMVLGGRSTMGPRRDTGVRPVTETAGPGGKTTARGTRITAPEARPGTEGTVRPAGGTTERGTRIMELVVKPRTVAANLGTRKARAMRVAMTTRAAATKEAATRALATRTRRLAPSMARAARAAMACTERPCRLVVSV